MDLSSEIADSLYNNGDKSFEGQWYIEENWKSLTKVQQQEIKDTGTIDKLMKITNTKALEIPNFPEQVNVSDFVNHIDYLVEKIGIDHIGISSDFDGGIEGWKDAS